ncbi:MAG: class I adenylate-forming enzyme family protein [Rhodopila sp.]|nr:class I adenylate-forming enzyme family protein [Rhodopila sp.]
MFEKRLETHWQRDILCYAIRPPTVDAMFRAAVGRAPDAEALVEGSVRYTYQDLNGLADACAAGLARRGVRQGDRVAVFLGNCLEAVVAVLGIARLGAILVPIGSRLRRREVEYVCGDAEPAALIYDAAFEAELPESGPPVRVRVGGVDEFAVLLAGGGVPPPCSTREDDPFGILYTSGTTGKPKGAILTQLGAVHSCLHWEECLGLRAGEISVLCIPWTHVAGLCGVVLPILHMAGKLVVVRNFARRAFLELAAAERMTHGLMVPAMYGLCLLEADLADFDLSAWRLGVFGSAPMPEPTIRRFAAAVPHLTMCNAYGATETTSPATIMPPGAGVSRMDSIGRTVPCGDIRVRDEEGRELPPGELGELWIAGPMIVPGYWHNPAATAASFEGGYWKSGDIGSVDAEGYVRIADRKKDMINRGGFKVYPAEVENVLCDKDGVVEAAVVGQPDPILGERSVAFIHARTPLSDAEIRAFCAERVADYKVPDWVVVSEEPLPRNANGKIQKDQLRRQAEVVVATTDRPRR